MRRRARAGNENEGERPALAVTLAEHAARGAAEAGWALIARDGARNRTRWGRVPNLAPHAATLRAVHYLLAELMPEGARGDIALSSAAAARDLAGEQRQGAHERARRIARERGLGALTWHHDDTSPQAATALRLARAAASGARAPSANTQAWTDGSWSPESGAGGWAAVIWSGPAERIVCAGGVCASPCEAETRAVLLALAHSRGPIVVRTDLRGLAEPEAPGGTQAQRAQIAEAAGEREVRIEWARGGSWEQGLVADAAASAARKRAEASTMEGSRGARARGARALRSAEGSILRA